MKKASSGRLSDALYKTDFTEKKSQHTLYGNTTKNAHKKGMAEQKRSANEEIRERLTVKSKMPIPIVTSSRQLPQHYCFCVFFLTFTKKRRQER